MARGADLKIGDLTGFAVETIRLLGEEAMQFFGKGRHRPPFDQELITQAELHLLDTFQETLRNRYLGHLIFGQDPLDDDYTHDAKRYLWVFDPLDGVDNFQSGIPIWGMSLALFENLWPVLGIFFMPATNDLFHACAGESAYWNDRPIHISDRSTISEESLLLTFSRFHRDYECTFPGKIRDFGSMGAHACFVAMGRADAAITGRESFKDLAAVRVIIESAGGTICQANGGEFFLGDHLDAQRIEEHLLITGKKKQRMIIDCLKKLGE
jgi:myo-inositol-1(or 4)-monophosphatase